MMVVLLVGHYLSTCERRKSQFDGTKCPIQYKCQSLTRILFKLYFAIIPYEAGERYCLTHDLFYKLFGIFLDRSFMQHEIRFFGFLVKYN